MFEVTEDMIKALDPAYGEPYEEYMFKDHRMGDKYACAVVQGEIVACGDVQNACRRYIVNRFREDLIFATPIVDRLHKFAQLAKFSTGLSVGKPLKVLGWISFMWNNMGGFYKQSEDGVWEKLYNNVLCLVAKGNSKTFLTAYYSSFASMVAETGIASYIVIASNENQAQYVVNAARDGIKTMPNPIQNLFTPAKRALLADTTSNELVGMPAEISSIDGRRIAVGVYDEFAEADKAELYANMNSSTLSSRSAQVICISTAGTNTQGIAVTEADIGRRVNLGEIENDHMFSIYYHVDGEISNWRVFDNLIKANPSLGHAVNTTKARSQHKIAVEKTDVEARGYIIKNCNIFVKDSVDAYIDLDDIIQSREEYTLEDMKGLPAILSIDYSISMDITSVCMFTPYTESKYRSITKNFTTRRAYKFATDEIRLQYDVAEESEIGFGEKNLTIFPGSSINQTVVLDYIIDCMERNKVMCIGFDDNGMNSQLLRYALKTRLKERRAKGSPVKMLKDEDIHSMRQGFGLSRGIDHNRGLIQDRLLKLSMKDRLIPWMLENAALKIGERGEYKLVKANSEVYKIDGVIAMAQCAYLLTPDPVDPTPTPKVSTT